MLYIKMFRSPFQFAINFRAQSRCAVCDLICSFALRPSLNNMFGYQQQPLWFDSEGPLVRYLLMLMGSTRSVKFVFSFFEDFHCARLTASQLILSVYLQILAEEKLEQKRERAYLNAHITHTHTYIHTGTHARTHTNSHTRTYTRIC